jgi:acyl-CoA reductase-like NAD-dependent aldehyde dehydrogenase
MDLLTISDNKVIPSAYTLTIKEFAKIAKRKNSAKELSYVYHMCDHSSPFAVYDVDVRHAEVASSIFDINWEPDEAVKAACDKYVSLKETSAIKLLKAARSAVNKLKNYFEIIDLTAIDDNGRPIYQAKDLVANLSKMADVVAGLSKLEDQVKKDEQSKSPNRGGVVVNKYSQ